ncbi:MAG: hypothetical protein H6581_26215 [Bacteroidia bacterium]|nr:hypothetical protein [Bacteroidia bacterium]
MEAKTIEEVIQHLEKIVEFARKKPSRIGYFASLYLLVTKKIKEEVDLGSESVFEDNARMERLDVIFANRYLAAFEEYEYHAFETQSWIVAMEYTQYWYPIVLQHLLGGMNAHISLDLGIAAAQVMQELGQPIEKLENDFNEINNILGSLVGQVEQELGRIWPMLKAILKIFPAKLDDQIVGFSMTLARDAAWKFSNSIFPLSGDAWNQAIATRDQKVAKFGKRVLSPPWWIKMPLLLVKLTEWGSISSQIAVLNGEKGWKPVINRHPKVKVQGA